MIGSLYARIGAAVAALALLAALWAGGYRAGSNAAHLACVDDKAAAAAAAVELIGQREAAGAAVEQAAQAREQTREQTLQTIEKEVIRYVERQPKPHAGTAGGPAIGAGTAAPVAAHPQDAGLPGCALDADGLRLWSAANRGDLPDPAGEADAAMSAIDP